MSIISIFKKKSKKVVENPEGIFVPLTKSLPSAGLEPISYQHTAAFLEDGADPLNFERERLSHKKVDWLLYEQRVPAIMADTLREIEAGKRQFVEHIYVCRKLIDIEKGELRRTLDMKETVQREIAEYDRLYEELIANSKKQRV